MDELFNDELKESLNKKAFYDKELDKVKAKYKQSTDEVNGKMKEIKAKLQKKYDAGELNLKQGETFISVFYNEAAVIMLDRDTITHLSLLPIQRLKDLEIEVQEGIQPEDEKEDGQINWPA